MDTTGTTAEQLAAALGSQPFVVLALMMVGVVGALLGVVWVVRLLDRRARSVWQAVVRALRAVAERPAVRRLATRFPRLWALLRGVPASEYLVLHLGLGLGLSLAVLGFLALASEVRQGDTLVRFDLALAQALHASSSPEGVAALRAFTLLGSGWVLAVLGSVVAAILLLQRRRVLAFGWIGALAGAGLLNTALKVLFARPRPSFAEPLVVSAGWSFPSGHTMGTFVTFGMLAYLGLLSVKESRQRLAVVVGALGWTTTMGFSRLYLGAHYLSDVAAGVMAGAVWLAACVSGIEVARRRPRRVDGQPVAA